MGARIERITAAVPPLEYSLWIVIIALDVVLRAFMHQAAQQVLGERRPTKS
jgi:hypothetical protein